MHAPAHLWLIYCRPGFERDCVEETRARPVEAIAHSGYVIVQGKPRLAFAELAFARQIIHLLGEVKELPERDRLSPLLAAIPAAPEEFGVLWLETPDTNEGKTLSGFTRRFLPLIEAELANAGRIVPDPANDAGTSAHPDNRTSALPRLHVFFPDRHRALIGSSDPGNSAAAQMGILRLKMPRDAPSRSCLKLAEAFEVLLDRKERVLWLRPGMTAVDLGAAPGGWTWHLVQRGLKVIAVDNGPLKGMAAEHPAIRHLRQDGFRYRPQRPVDWVVCDMVEQPQRVAALMADWIASGASTRAIFNLKLPMKKRAAALASAMNIVRDTLDAIGMRYRLQAKQLYHDREEVTVLLARVKR